mmetsp:Transcript_50356/g.89634  ORF Transcript_50356/g.89634 Transcript_50356/m.89634 type:complete len:215 (+) Transcript_50356:844-1488(+)
MPFTIVSNSGTERISRASRDNRNSLRSRSTPRSLSGLPPSPVSKNGITHVSKTMITTSPASNRNHQSFKQSSFRAKAANRIKISTVKYTQKMFSTILITIEVSSSVFALLISASIPIQMALMKMTNNVTYSKGRLCATRTMQPPSSLWYMKAFDVGRRISSVSDRALGGLRLELSLPSLSTLVDELAILDCERSKVSAASSSGPALVICHAMLP